MFPRRLFLAAMIVLLGPAAQAQTCPFAGQKPMLVIQMFFGQDIAGGRHLSAAEWNAFARKILTPRFPDGLTIYEARGQWRDSSTSKIVREPAKVVVIAVDAASDVRKRVDDIARLYKQRFRQQSVGIVSTLGCGAF